VAAGRSFGCGRRFVGAGFGHVDIVAGSVIMTRARKSRAQIASG
jgi:hypothetical protein